MDYDKVAKSIIQDNIFSVIVSSVVTTTEINQKLNSEEDKNIRFIRFDTASMNNDILNIFLCFLKKQKIEPSKNDDCLVYSYVTSEHEEADVKSYIQHLFTHEFDSFFETYLSESNIMSISAYILMLTLSLKVELGLLVFKQKDKI